MKYFRNLTFWVLLSLVVGVVLGVYRPEQAVSIGFLGKGFIGIVKWFIHPIIFLTITLGICGVGDLRQVGRTGAKALVYFEVVTTLALLIGIVVAMWVRPGEGVDIRFAAGSDVSGFVRDSGRFRWATFFYQNTTLQVLFLSIGVDVLISRISRLRAVLPYLERGALFTFKVLHVVMYLSPIGAFGGMAFTVGKFGITSLIALGKLLLSVYITMGLFIFLVLGFILHRYQISIWRFIKYLRAELLVVLGTSSSEAALPSLMEKLERMGCGRQVVGLVVPAGYSFNLDGTTLYLSMAVMFLAQAYGVEMTLGQVFALIGVLMVTSKGAAGVTGSGFIVLASTLQAVDFIPVEGLALLLGVDRFMSEARALTNIIGNGVATVWLSNHERVFDREQMEVAFKLEERGSF